jgi:DNA-binding transcriptional MerR regulator
MQVQKEAVVKKFLSTEEIAKELNIKKFLVRFWEKEFNLKLKHSGADNRCYLQHDLAVFATIKDLIHNKKMSLSQAKKKMQEVLNNQKNNINDDKIFTAAHHEQIDILNEKSSIGSSSIKDSFTHPTINISENLNAHLGKPQEDIFMDNVQALKEKLINLKELLDID